MKFAMIKDLDDEKFRRLTGIKRTTFEKMTIILYKSGKDKKNKRREKEQIKH